MGRVEITGRPTQVDADSWTVPLRIKRTGETEWTPREITVDELPENPTDDDFKARVQHYRPNDVVTWGAE